MSASVNKANADLSAAQSQIASYKTQLDALNQQTQDMQKSADLQRKDFERESEKLRREQKDLIRSLKSQPLEGTPGLQINYIQPRERTTTILAAYSRPIIEELGGYKKMHHSSGADDEHFTAGPFHPCHLDFPVAMTNQKMMIADAKDKKGKKKGQKPSRGRSRR